MKEGKTLVELAQEVARRAESKNDFIADTGQLEMLATPTSDAPAAPLSAALKINGHGVFNVTSFAHGQISAHTEIPKRYYDRMLTEAPGLLAANVNRWLHGKAEKRMVRTLDGSARAFLSNRYRILDNEEILGSVLPVIEEMNDRGQALTIASSEVTERRLYLKCLFPKIQAEVKPGDLVQAGFVLANSEIGAGGVSVFPLVMRLVCRNGAMVNDMGTRKYHIGRQVGGDALTELFFKDDTLKADDQAFLLKMRDTVAAVADETRFALIVNKMREATEDRIEKAVPQVVEVVAKRFTLNDTEAGNVLNRLIQGADLSRYGVLNAVTRASQDVEDYDRATDLEAIGGQIINLPRSEWREITREAEAIAA